MWSDPNLIGTQLPGTFCHVKGRKIGSTPMETEIMKSASLGRRQA